MPLLRMAKYDQNLAIWSHWTYTVKTKPFTFMQCPGYNVAHISILPFPFFNGPSPASFLIIIGLFQTHKFYYKWILKSQSYLLWWDSNL